MLKPYEEYKKSKSPFHRNIPSHWTEKRLAAVCSIKCVQNNEGEELLSVFLNRGVINYKDTHQKQVHKPSEDMSKYQLVEPGDLVLNNQQAWRGSVGVSKYRGIVSPAYYVYSINDDINPFFLNYMVRDRDVVDQFVLASKGVGSIQRMLNNSYLKNVIFTIPPREEQDQIVRFLEWKLAKTNKLIRAKKKQIELLNEQKQVIINDAVTKGLDPNVPMKDSEIEGIGLVPKHWQFYQLGKVAKIILSGLDKKTYEGQQPVLLCNYVDVYKNDYITGGLAFMKATASDTELDTLKVCKDDVIITKDSETWDDIGVPAYVAQEIENLYCGYHLAILRTNKSIVLGEFLYNAFRSQYVQIQHKLKAKGVTRFSLGYQPIHDTILLIPTIEEQEAIVRKIRNDCHVQDAFIKKIKKEIELLLEYKTSLVSSVVTGKVDVRGIVVPDYESIEEITDDELQEGHEADDAEEME